ncbi:unnamed protein product, partial [Durusdinium trenchii]
LVCICITFFYPQQLHAGSHGLDASLMSTQVEMFMPDVAHGNDSGENATANVTTSFIDFPVDFNTNFSNNTENASAEPVVGGATTANPDLPGEGTLSPVYSASTTVLFGGLGVEQGPQSPDSLTKIFAVIVFVVLVVIFGYVWRSSLSEWIGGEDDDDVVIAGPLSRRQRLPPLSVSQPGHADYYDMSTPRLEGRLPGLG